MGRNYLAHAANPVLVAAGYNFRRLLAWLAILLRAWMATHPRRRRTVSRSICLRAIGVIHGRLLSAPQHT